MNGLQSNFENAELVKESQKPNVQTHQDAPFETKLRVEGLEQVQAGRHLVATGSNGGEGRDHLCVGGPLNVLASHLGTEIQI